ncbi:lipid A deacylase LpxR family protein [Spirosoma sp. KNUC1025]|uniref:lipid A deacylase LpxR family protein n=1 Tax=Spirosoma sp. KNUC1025 TaxID=2894082 RepID=UPI0038674E57|nr:lipid A deacylase LpxR family protein [Spirosoma sp. KNUC1025]
MKPSLILTLFLCFYGSCGHSQHPYELKVTSDNDNYCLQLHDGYYTNGLFLTLNYVPNWLSKRIRETGKLTKITSSYQLGQMIFTPGVISPTLSRDLIDRPFAGYLFAEKGMTFFYKKGHVLKTSLSIGTTGPNSLAQQSQFFIHKTLELDLPKGWQYQVKNEVGINIQGQYWHELIPESWRRKWLDIHATSQVTLGNTFTNVSAGLLFQMGLFEATGQSSLYGARIDNDQSSSRKPNELYVFFYPSYQYQLYNATVEGRFFSDNAGSVLSPIRHWLYKNDVGFVYSLPRWTFQVVYSFKGREATRMRQPENYVSLATSFRFGHQNH